MVDTGLHDDLVPDAVGNARLDGQVDFLFSLDHPGVRLVVQAIPPCDSDLGPARLIKRCQSRRTVAGFDAQARRLLPVPCEKVAEPKKAPALLVPEPDIIGGFLAAI